MHSNLRFISFVFLMIVSCGSNETAIPEITAQPTPDAVPTTITTPASRCLFPSFDVHPQGNLVKTLEGESFRAIDPFVMYDADESKFKMWYTLYYRKTLGTAYTESQDGVRWKLYSTVDRERLVLKPTEGTWDHRGIETVTVLKKDGRYLLWYLGYPGTHLKPEAGRFKYIGFATSSDGIRWEKHPQPVLTPESEWEQPYQRVVWEGGKEIRIWDGGVQEPSVLWNEEKQIYQMWYEANSMWHGKWQQNIGYAISKNGIQWEKHPENPVFRPNLQDTWDASPVGHTNVVRTRDGYHLFYASGGYRVSIGHAFSVDGIAWQRDPANKPVVQSNLTVQDAKAIKQGAPPPAYAIVYGGPSAIVRDGRFWLYYSRSKEGVIDFSKEFYVGLSIAECGN